MRSRTKSRRAWALGALAAEVMFVACNTLDGLDTAYTEVGCLGAGCPDGSARPSGGTGGASTASHAASTGTGGVSSASHAASTGTGGAGTGGAGGTGGFGGTLPTGLAEADSLVLWLRGEDWNGSTWTDRSSGGRDATLYFGDVGSGSLNGHKVAAFDGNGDLIITAGFPDWYGLSILTVVNTPIQNGSGIIAMGVSFNAGCYTLAPGGAPGCVLYDMLQFNAYLSLEQCDPTIGNCYKVFGMPDAAGAGWVRLSGVLDVGATPAYRVYLNGVDEGALGHDYTYPYPSPWATPRTDTIVGWGTSASNLFPGSIAEFIIYNTTLSDASREAIDAYLQSKWGL
jgi:hypothetical protein